MANLAEDIEKQIDLASERAGEGPLPVTAVTASFDCGLRLLLVNLSNGQRLSIPQEDLQGLADVSVDDAADFELDSFGSALWWEKLDLGFTVEGLVKGRTGNAAWMKRLHEEHNSSGAVALAG